VSPDELVRRVGPRRGCSRRPVPFQILVVRVGDLTDKLGTAGGNARWYRRHRAEPSAAHVLYCDASSFRLPASTVCVGPCSSVAVFFGGV
jgi:hypothetical protein